MPFDGSPLFAAFAPGAPFTAAVSLMSGILAVMTVVWFVLLLWLFHRLRNRHAPTYEAIGSPSLIWNNSLRAQWLLLKFLYSSRRRELDDEPASKVIGFLRVLLPLYHVVFITLIILFLTTTPD